jgi:hypothetical protein
VAIAVVSNGETTAPSDANEATDVANVPVAAKGDAARADAARAAVARALRRDAACTSATCDMPAALANRAARVSTVVRRLDSVYALGRTRTAKLQRVATSAFLHAALELRSCIQLSGEKHGGDVDMSECHAPLAQYQERTEDLRAAVRAAP